MGDLIQWLVEKNFVEPSGNFLPFPLRRLGKLICIRIKPLMKKANGENRLLATTGRKFGQALKQEDVLSIGMVSSKFQELTQLIQNDEKTLSLFFCNQF